MIGFIFVFLIVFAISCALGGIPFGVFIIINEIAGIDHYMYVMSYLFLSLVELVIFLGYVFGVKLSFKDFFSWIKNLFKTIFRKSKDKDDKKKYKNKQKKYDF